MTDRALRSRTVARGYGPEHKRLRASEARRIAAGGVRCARGPACKFAELVDGELRGGVIEPGAAWDLGHDDRDRTFYRGPEHQECNRATMGRAGTRRRPPEDHPGFREP